MATYNLTVRVHEISVLSKYKPTLQKQILKEENITKAMVGRSLWTYTTRDKTKIDVHIGTFTGG
jgi:hypothetical protein